MLQSRSKYVPDHQACLDQVARIVNSAVLQGSSGLCRLIQFLAEHALNFPAEHLKEYQIATEALGRPHGFDPHSDSSVRVQMGRLRDKIAEYYASYGKNDPVLIELPKGSYSLLFKPQPSTHHPGQATRVDVPSVIAQQQTVRSAQKWFSQIAFIGFAVIIIALAAVLLIHHWQSVHSGHPSTLPGDSDTALQIFWSPFLHASDQPFVVFKNLSFVGNDMVGMHQFDPGRDNPNQLIHGFTGIGEVMGMLRLTRLFDRFGGEFRLKREDLFTVDDARHSNLIFLGSPGTTLSMSQIPSTTEFVFHRQMDGPNRFRWEIIDSNPAPGAAKVYRGGAMSAPVDTEYALVSLKKGMDPSNWTLFLEGTSTVSTQAAVDLVCNNQSVRDILNRLHQTSDSSPRTFEAMLRVKVANDVPVETVLVDLRPTQQ